ncbi:MAG TPA: hypothetical protein VJS38_04370 [Phenylobacterium sp.]|uniref:hypothetical protein n=1 Tax=Phenylobacterium sp. TaxID=1871053 RepID=UPI002B4A7778|nr:hypothetical protein [Phenylobacterium sp.]HKR87385.1 hypothetical protein [Phenylobacterium sp.]HKT54902.1 hypothetical protein [Caulobacteraceae bacterium]
MRLDVHRLLLLAAGLAIAWGAPAQAQTIQQQMQLNILDTQIRAREAMANRQAIGLQNQMQALDAQLHTQQSLGDIRAQSYSPTIPQYAGAPPVNIDTSQLASIPDDRLAASNQRVLDAAANRH